MLYPEPFLHPHNGQHTEHLDQYLPDYIHTYTEPFLGDGSTFIHVLHTHPEIQSATANDINDRLISAYIAIQQQHHNLLEELYYLQHAYNNTNNKQLFLSQQRAKFNELVDNSLHHKDYNSYLIENAATLILLHNASHNNNTPIYNEQNINSLHQLFQHTNFTYGHFTNTKYNSPHILNHQHLFLFNTPHSFKQYQQYQLKDLCDSIDNQGIRFIQFNSYNPQLKELYKDYYLQPLTKQLLITNF